MMSRAALRRAYLDWFNSLDGQIAFTGSARQGVSFDGYFQLVDVEELSSNVDCVLRRVSRDTFSRRQIRHGTKIWYAGAIEGGADRFKRMHVHLTIGGFPAEVPLERARDALQYHWQNSWWGYRDVHSVPLRDEEAKRGWNKYLMKDFDPAETERWVTNLRTI